MVRRLAQALGAYILLIGYMIWACRKTDSADNK